MQIAKYNERLVVINFIFAAKLYIFLKPSQKNEWINDE